MHRSWRFGRGCAVVAALALALPLAACSDDEDDATPAASSSATSETGQELTVFAASSLTETFTDLGHKFEAAHSGVTVTFNFGSSATLATQINEGAPADVFAAASPTTMKTVTDAGNGEGTPVTFVRNKLEIAVPSGNPGKVEGLDDFAKDDLDIALCDVSVPCGAAAEKAFTAAGVTPKPDTRETDVKATLTKVQLGEVDAALVYQTDVEAANKANPNQVEGINFPEADQAINEYQIVALKDSDSSDLAADWVDYVSSPEAQDVLTAAGFQPGTGADSSAGATPSAEPTDASSDSSSEAGESPSPTSS